MLGSRYFSSRLAFATVAFIGMTANDSPLLAQLGGFQPGSGAPMPSTSVKLKEPVASRVYQRDANGRADIPIALDDSYKDAKLLDASINSPNMALMGTKFVDGKIVGVPVGGPYTIQCRLEIDKRNITTTAGPVYVGDLWVLAGQSNMEGVGI